MDLDVRIREFKEKGDLIEAQRIAQRTQYDIEMLRELGYCTGIENYSRYFDGRKPGDAPYTLLDYFPEDYVCLCRRKPRHPAADPRDVQRRPRAQGSAGRLRLPPAQRV